MNYRKSKEEWARQALDHNKEMEQTYNESIRESVQNTVVYGEPNRIPAPAELIQTHTSPGLVLVKTDSVSAAFDNPVSYNKEPTAILNFANYKNPGGLFLKGSSAQEESLCHSSNLFNVLARFDKTYYAWNREHLNRAMYTDRALYSPKIIFEKEAGKNLKSIRHFDIITCAAPNIGVARRYQGVTKEENSEILRNRIRFIRDIAEEQKVKTFILGAFGCGVFHQNATEVAEIFLDEFRYSTIDCLIFAVPDDRNHKKFLDVFEKEEKENR